MLKKGGGGKCSVALADNISVANYYFPPKIVGEPGEREGEGGRKLFRTYRNLLTFSVIFVNLANCLL